MSNSANTSFIDWLNTKLCELNTDESVFGAYILGILEGDETNEEKMDAVEGILSEIIENNLQELVAEILNKWDKCHPKVDPPNRSLSNIDVNQKLAKLLEAQKLQTVEERHFTVEERKIKEQILAQYSQTSISENEYEDSGDETKAKDTKEKACKTSNCGLERNRNAEDVMQLQKEKREQARLDCAAKKKKDKEDREKQKQIREEKKEKRKTVKGERRR